MGKGNATAKYLANVNGIFTRFAAAVLKSEFRPSASRSTPEPLPSLISMGPGRHRLARNILGNFPDGNSTRSRGEKARVARRRKGRRESVELHLPAMRRVFHRFRAAPSRVTKKDCQAAVALVSDSPRGTNGPLRRVSRRDASP